MTDVEIRTTAGGADLEAAAALERRCLPVARSGHARFGSEPGRRIWVACLTEGGRESVAGVLVAQQVVDAVEILSLAVEPGRRRGGIATALLERELAEGAARGVRKAHLEVAESNPAARALYHRAGFREVGRRPGYYEHAEDALLLTRAVQAPQGARSEAKPSEVQPAGARSRGEPEARRAGRAALPSVSPQGAKPSEVQRVDAEVVSNRPEGGANHRLVLRVPGGLRFAPGQFLMVSAGARASAERFDPLLPRPMAIYRVTARDGGAELEILYKVHGRGTALLADAAPGERVRAVGPLGRGFPLGAEACDAVLVGGGTGIASLFDLAARLPVGRATVLLGARTAADLMGVADFAGIGVDLRIATEDGSEGTLGRVTELLPAALAERPGAAVHACGPTPMMRAAAEIAERHGRRCLVSLENTMACGFGVCLGCAVPRRAGGFALVCRDGPVFDAGGIAWEGLS